MKTVNQISEEKKEAVSIKTIVRELWSGEHSVIDPLIPAVIEAWGRVVPDSIRQGICLEGIREGTLHLLVSNPVVGQQFQFLRETIREKINVILGAPVVKEIRVKPGTFPTNPASVPTKQGSFPEMRPRDPESGDYKSPSPGKR
jgi:hypothetical protein